MDRRRQCALGALLLVVAACGETAEAPTLSAPSSAAQATAPPESEPPTSRTTDPMNDDTTPTPDDPPGTDAGDGPRTTGELRPAPATDQPRPIGSDDPAGTVDPALGSIVEMAAADLADRLAADRPAISVVAAEQVVWPDSSLGCPQPGMAYLQVLTDGFRILLEHDGRTYSYHGGGNRLDPFLCEQPAKPVEDAAGGAGGGDS